MVTLCIRAPHGGRKRAEKVETVPQRYGPGVRRQLTRPRKVGKMSVEEQVEREVDADELAAELAELALVEVLELAR